MESLTLNLPLGPLMIDVEALALTGHDLERLKHPLVGGVILFSRNYQDRQQLQSLVKEIKAIRKPALLVAVDQEGGRVQRFKEGFSPLPPAASFGEAWSLDKQSAPVKAFESAYLMATELLEVGIDISFAPVFDLSQVESEVIGDRSFHKDPKIATELLGAYVDGMHTAGMPAIAKHFPGHGGVAGDSHHCLPCDERSLEQLWENDLLPYRELVNEIQGVMSTHVYFTNCDQDIPTYSHYWLNQVLREQMQFNGLVFSDDLSMEAAIQASARQDKRSENQESNIVDAVSRALNAGCEMVLICNRPDLVDAVLEHFEYTASEANSARLSFLSAPS